METYSCKNPSVSSPAGTAWLQQPPAQSQWRPLGSPHAQACLVLAPMGRPWLWETWRRPSNQPWKWWPTHPRPSLDLRDHEYPPLRMGSHIISILPRAVTHWGICEAICEVQKTGQNKLRDLKHMTSDQGWGGTNCGWGQFSRGKRF